MQECQWYLRINDGWIPELQSLCGAGQWYGEADGSLEQAKFGRLTDIIAVSPPPPSSPTAPAAAVDANEKEIAASTRRPWLIVCDERSVRKIDLHTCIVSTLIGLPARHTAPKPLLSSGESKKKVRDAVTGADVAARVTIQKPLALAVIPTGSFDSKMYGDVSLAVKQNDVSIDDARLALYVSTATAIRKYQYGMLSHVTGDPHKSGSEDGVLSRASYFWLRSLLVSTHDPMRMYAVDSNTIRGINLRTGKVNCVAAYYGKDKHTNGDAFNSHIDTPRALCWRPDPHHQYDPSRPDSFMYIAASSAIRTLQLPYDLDQVLNNELSYRHCPVLRELLPNELVSLIGSYLATPNGWLDTLPLQMATPYGNLRFDPTALASTPSGVLIMPVYEQSRVLGVDTANGDVMEVWSLRKHAATTGGRPPFGPQTGGVRDLAAAGNDHPVQSGWLYAPAGCAISESEQCAYICDSEASAIRRLTLSPNWFKLPRPPGHETGRVHKPSGRSNGTHNKMKKRSNK